MVIGFDAKRAFCNRTGLGNYSRLLLSSLSECFPQERLLLFTPSTNTPFANFFEGKNNIQVLTPSHSGKIPSSIWRTFAPAKLSRQENLSIFHGLSHELPLGMPSKVATVLTMHDLVVWRHPEYFPFFDSKIYQLKQRISCRNADVIVAISEQTKRDLGDIMGIPEEKIRVVYQSCHPIFWQPQSQETVQNVLRNYSLPQRYVLCVGSIERRKNQLSLIKSIPLWKNNLGVVIVGKDGPYKEELQREITRLGIETRVTFLHNAHFEDFPALYQGALCSCYVSEFEGFGIPILESMCCGTPVVCSNTSSMPEVGGEAALYVSPFEVEEIALQVNRLQEDEAFHRERSRMCLEERERFAPQRIAREMMAVYKELR